LASLKAEHPGRDFAALESLLPGPDVWESKGNNYYYKASAERGQNNKVLCLKVWRHDSEPTPCILEVEDVIDFRKMLDRFIEGRRLDGGEL